MSAVDGVPLEEMLGKRELSKAMEKFDDPKDKRIAELESMQPFVELAKYRARIEELEGENNSVKALHEKSENKNTVLGLNYLELQGLYHELRGLVDDMEKDIRNARQVLMNCNLEHQRTNWIDARKAWLEMFDKNYRGVV